MRRSPLAVFVLACCALGACSRGSGGGSPPSTNLTVVAQLPAPNTIVEPTATIAVAFAEPLDASSVHPDSVQVTDELGVIGGTTSYDAATRTVRWVSRFGLTLAARHSVVLSGSVRDVGGSSLGADLEWDFVVRDGDWSGPEPIFGVVGVAMQRSGRAWYAQFDGTITTGTPGDWAAVPVPAAGRPVGVVCSLQDEVTVCATRLWAHGAPDPAGNTQRFVVEAITRDASAGANGGWTAVTLVDELCRHATTQFFGSTFGDPIVAHSRTVGPTPAGNTIAGSMHRMRIASAAPNTWRSFPHYNLYPLPAAVDARGRHVTLGDDGSEYVSLVVDDGLQRQSVPLSEPVPIGSFRQGGIDANDRLLLMQQEAASPGGYRLTARRIFDDGGVEPAAVLRTGDSDMLPYLVTSAAGHALCLSHDAPLARGESRFFVHRFDPVSGVWSQLQPLRIRSRSSDSVVADSRGTFWMAIDAVAPGGGSSLSVYRLRPGDLDVQEVFSAEGYSGAGLAVDDTGRATMRANVGLLRFQ